MGTGVVMRLGTAAVALVAVAAMLSGCAALGAHGITGASASAVPTPPSVSGPALPPTAEPTPTPTAEPAPPPNDLDPARINELTAMCPGAFSEAMLRALPQFGADALSFFATTGQCGDIGSVLAAGDYSRPFVSPLQYIDAPCPAGTLLTVWAHYDDDLLFGSPTIPHTLDANQCVRTLYLTASDAGRGEQYSLNRELGLRAAYDAIRGAATPWETRTVHLANGITVVMTRPSGDPRITLFFLRLPDGGLDANGFAATGHSSIPKLLDGVISQVERLGGAGLITAQSLPAVVSQLYDAYAPVIVMANLPGIAQGSKGDHPDHADTGNIIAGMVDRGLIDPSKVVYSQGYSIANRPVNLQGADLARKLDVFAKYAAHDSVLKCSTAEACSKLRRTGPWLPRQYLIPHTEIVRESS